jgi:hypothetical protein
MPTVNGQIRQSNELFHVPTLTTDFDGTHTKDAVRQGLLALSGSTGAATELIIPGPGVTEPGSRNQYTFYDDFYERFYFIPAAVDFQAVAADTVRPVKIWNAYIQTVNLNAIGALNLPDVTVSLPGALPLQFLPLQFHEVEFIASQEGTPDINGAVSFTFSNGVSKSLGVSGTRAKIWDYGMNWKSNFEVEVEFKTEIITSYNKNEQRIAQRQTPRKNISFNFRAVRDDFNKLNRTMTQWAGRTFVVPDHAKFVSLTAPLAIFGNTVLVDSVPSWAVPGAMVCLIAGKTVEVRTVLATASGEITFSNISGTVFPSGARVHYAYPARLAQDLTARRHTNAVQTATVRFQVIPALEPLLPLPAAPITFNGREVWLKRFNWADDITAEFQFFREQIDYGRGRAATFSPVEFNTRVIKGTMLAKNKQQVEEIENFFRRCKGQQRDFYRPTFENDLPQRVAATMGSVFLRVPGTDTLLAFENDPYNKAVFVLFNDGTYEMNKLVDMQIVNDLLGEDTRLEFENPWSRELNDSVVLISWLPLCRHSSDTLSYNYVTDSVCDVTMVMQYTKEYEAETLP